MLFINVLFKAAFKLTVYTVMINYGITYEIPCFLEYFYLAELV